MTTDFASLNILIAEDSPTQAQRLQYTLERHGCRITAAADGRSALEAIAVRRPDLVITDVVMPEMDGYQLCRRIKSDGQLKSIPVILLTTLSDPQDLVEGLECQADYFIVKPFEEAVLLSRIRAALSRSDAKEDEAGGTEIDFGGRRRVIKADRHQILNLLLSTYDAAMQRNQDLTRARDDLNNANAALQVSNRELEAFSYSVSHDLRAPLRAVDGFAHLLLEECGSKLDENGRELIDRVLAGCKRMSELIEDLLGLARVARSEMRRERVDLSALATLVLGELQKNDAARKVDWRVEPGLAAQGDARLLRIVLENLLGNAWKFSSRQSRPMIEMASSRQGDQVVFLVRDNGAGFEMAYAEKLFGVFQRLHSNDDFPGNGVGLATVQRIVLRHGGRIWAESAVGKGATFFFTLPGT